MPRTKKTAAAFSHEDDHRSRTDQYLQDKLAALEGEFDREAVLLLCNYGVFSVDDPCHLNDAVERLYDPSYRREFDGAITVLLHTQLTKEQEALVREIEDLPMKELLDATDAAYMLGIAVGRRLGSLALRPAPRSRKAVA